MARTASDAMSGNQNLKIGDSVDVPGGMYGTIRFIGEVKGKKGIFAGVELGREWAARGKNDGDVEGTKYFSTTMRGAGIFLPSNKAYKRLSPPFSTSRSPATPAAPSLAAYNEGSRGVSRMQTPPAASMSNLSKTVGPGAAARARSPDFKPKARPSLPRPESPLRKTQIISATPQLRSSIGGSNLSKSVIGNSRYAPSPTPSRFGASVGGPRNGTGDPGKRLPVTPKSEIRQLHSRIQSRSESRSESRTDYTLGPEPMFDSESDNTPVAVSKTELGSQKPIQLSAAVSERKQLEELRLRLAERDKQLEQQAADIAEMANSVNELESNKPRHSSLTTTRSLRGSGVEDLDAPSLRALVREKNDRINQLTDEFDSHRADFRDTIDTLEHTSDETNRLYQEKIAAQDVQIREMHDRIDRGEDMESVALQLKQLEELVQELEEGLEDARRGEAEARGEVEFLRGEVERGRAELHREKSKAIVVPKIHGPSVDGSSSPEAVREMRRKEDEIKGLKAIIQSMGQDDGPNKGSPKSGRRLSKQRHRTNGKFDDADYDHQSVEGQQLREKFEREIKDLESLVDRKTYREEELELEVERLRRANSHMSSHSHEMSASTTRPNSDAVPSSVQLRPSASRNPSIDWEERGVKDANKGFVGQPLESMPETHSDSHSTTMTDSSNLWCEICDAGGHDVLTCTKMFGIPAADNGKRNGNHIDHSHGHNSRLTTDDVERDFSLDEKISLPQYHPVESAPQSQSAHSLDTEALTPTAPRLSAVPGSTDPNLVAGKSSGIADGNKWCGICERDGHDATDCPYEGDF